MATKPMEHLLKYASRGNPTAQAPVITEPNDRSLMHVCTNLRGERETDWNYNNNAGRKH